MMGHLFIGGPADGKRVVVKDSMPYYKFRQYPQLGEWSRESKTEEFKFIDHTYIRHKMTSGHFVYAHDAIRPEEIVGLLIRGYGRPDPL